MSRVSGPMLTLRFFGVFLGTLCGAGPNETTPPLRSWPGFVVYPRRCLLTKPHGMPKFARGWCAK